MNRNLKSRNRSEKDEPGRQVLQKAAQKKESQEKETNPLKATIGTDRKYENRGYYSRNGSYSGYNGL